MAVKLTIKCSSDWHNNLIKNVTIDIAANGQIVIDKLNAQDYDVVLMDVNMPIMNGHDFIEKAVQRWPDMPIIVVSGIGGVNQAVEALRIGARDFITKPIENFSLVNNTIEKAFEAVELIRQNRVRDP